MPASLTSPGRGWTVASFAAAGTALWVWPPILGAIALASAVMAVARGDRLGRLAVVAAIVGLVAGLLLHLLPEPFFA